MNIRKEERGKNFMKSKKAIVTLLVAGMLFTGCGLKNQNAIIKINDNAITQSDFDKSMDEQIARSPFAQMGGVENFKKDKDGMLYLMTEKQVINFLITQELVNQQVKKAGIKVSNKEVQEMIAKIMKSYGGKEKFTEALKASGLSAAQFKKEVKDQVKVRKLVQSKEKINVSDKDCKDFYDKNPDKFKQPELVRASHILLTANPVQLQEEIKNNSKEKLSEKDLKAKVDAKMKEQKDLAEKLAKELKVDNSKFAAYAKKYSQDQNSAIQGGDLGFFPADRMVPEFSKAAFAAKPNTVTGVVKTDFGYHIIFVTDRKAAGKVPYEKVKADIKEFLTAQKEIKVLDDIVSAAKKEAKIEIINKDYDPETIEKKLSKQLGSLKEQVQTPQAAKAQEAKKQPAKK